MNRDKKISVGALWLGRAFAGILLAVTAQAWASVTATLTAPVEGSIYTPLADITLTADAGAGQGFTLSKVEFFSGTNLIGTDFSAPYSITWSGASLGQHSLTAKATAVKKNNPDQTATSVAVNITVKAQLAFIHTDHLNTPRLVADATGTTVWRWDQAEPFGNNPADQDPDGNLVAFDLPLRLPGQRYDAETGLHYNYFRDYDPSVGRYAESDPIGLRGGLNTYAYVNGNPTSFSDPNGLLQFPLPVSQQDAARAMACAHNPSLCAPREPGKEHCFVTCTLTTVLMGIPPEQITQYSLNKLIEKYISERELAKLVCRAVIKRVAFVQSMVDVGQCYQICFECGGKACKPEMTSPPAFPPEASFP